MADLEFLFEKLLQTYHEDREQDKLKFGYLVVRLEEFFTRKVQKKVGEGTSWAGQHQRSRLLGATEEQGCTGEDFLGTEPLARD